MAEEPKPAPGPIETTLATVKPSYDLIGLAGSLVTLIVGIVRSLSNKARPPTLTLAVCSALAIVAVTWIAFARKPSLRSIVALCLGTLAVIAAAWVFVYRDRLSYMWFARLGHATDRIRISNSIAWDVLTYTDANGEEVSHTLVGELAQILSNKRYRLLVQSDDSLAADTPTENDAFQLTGVADASGIVLKGQLILNSSRVTHMLEYVKRPVDLRNKDDKDAPLIVTPGKHFFRNQFLFSHFQLELALASQSTGVQRASATRLLLRYLSAMQFYFDGDTADAKRLFEELLSLSRVVQKAGSPKLAPIFKSTAYFLAVEAHDLDGALEALRAAEEADSSDPEIGMMMSYVLMCAGRLDQAGAAIMKLDPLRYEKGQILALQGTYYFAVEDFPRAVAAFTQAIKVEKDAHYRAVFHLNCALACALSDKCGDSKDRSAPMIEELTDAIDIEQGLCPAHLLLGYAWALRGQTKFSDDAIARARAIGDDGQPCPPELLTYWVGKIDFELHRYASAAAGASDAKDINDASLATMIGHNLSVLPGRATEAERYLRRALEIDPNLAEAHRYLGSFLAKQYADMPIDRRDERARLNEQARRHISAAIAKEGGDSAAGHRLLAVLYEGAGDQVNADRHSRVACEQHPDDVDCSFSRASLLLKAGKFTEVRELFAALNGAAPSDSSLRLQEGVAWYKIGRLNEAEAAYREAVRLDPSSVDAHDNLGYVFFDLDHPRDALAEWQRALAQDPRNADCLAGKGIALAALGRRPEAIVAFRAAVQIDKGYFDSELLKKERMWSEKACIAAAPLMEDVRSSLAVHRE